MHCWKKNALSPKERRGYILLNLILNITKNILTKDVSSSEYPVGQRMLCSSFQIYLQKSKSDQHKHPHNHERREREEGKLWQVGNTYT